jgi:hypothetical protein
VGKKTRPVPRRAPRQDARARLDRPRALVLSAGLVAGAALVAAAALALGRDGASRPDDPAAPAGLAADPGPVHVHGLGVDPADGALLIATHTGTYRLSPGEDRARRIGESRQDTMGFTVAGPGTFLGSGHPDPQQAVELGLPPHLGLIESRDGGRTWRNVSLLGQADFHVLRVAAPRVYGYDASHDRLLVSRDRGRTWRESVRPAPLADLVVDPADGRRVVASGRGGVYASADEGATWRRVAPHLGLLAWPAPRRLYLVDADGAVLRARDGTAWQRVGSVGAAPAAFLAHGPTELYVALHDGTILRSTEGGRTWSVRSRPGADARAPPARRAPRACAPAGSSARRTR